MSDKKRFIDKKFNIDDAGLFFANYIAPWIFAALVGGLVFACGRAIREDGKYKHSQPVPVNKTVMWVPKEIDKKTTASFNCVKKMITSKNSENFINAK